MKILSLFTKAPQHQRFKYNPRFYDPVKEELKEREDRIQSEIERARGEVRQESGEYKSRIAGSFQAARKGSKPGSDTSATMIRLSILLFLTVLIVAYLEWGQPAFYLLFLFVPFYFYLKFKRK
jgi:hypothetical protein